jgi:hypothetical protein
MIRRPRKASSRSHRTLAVLLGTAGLGVALALPVAPGAAWADEAAAGGRMRSFSAGASADTLDYGWRDVFPEALEQLEANRWTIDRADTASRRIVTAWKSIDHVLVRAFLPDVQARCVVDVLPLPDGRSVITVRGGLASREDLDSNPGLPAALTVFRGAADRWVGRVRKALAKHEAEGLVARVPAGLPPRTAELVGAPAAASPSPSPSR